MAALERSLGSKIVARSTRGVTATEAGRIMVEAAESVNSGLEHARRQVERLDTGRTKLTIATFTSRGRLLLPAAFARLTAAHHLAPVQHRPGVPDTERPVVKAEPEGSLPLVRQGVVDWRSPTTSTARCRAGPARVPARGGRPSLDDPLYVVLPEGHRLADRDRVGLAEPAAEPWVLGCLKTEAYLRPTPNAPGSPRWCEAARRTTSSPGRPSPRASESH